MMCWSRSVSKIRRSPRSHARDGIRSRTNRLAFEVLESRILLAAEFNGPLLGS